MLKKRRILFFLLMGLAVLPAWGLTPEQEAANADAQAWGNSLVPGVVDGVVNATPEQDVPGYDPAPQPQEQYYGNPSAMDADAVQALPNSEAGTFARESFGERPQFVFDRQNDPMFQNSDAIAADPVSVVGQIDQTYSGCETIDSTGDCTPTFSEVMCDETLKTEDFVCNKTLDVQVQRNEFFSCNAGQWYSVSTTGLPEAGSANANLYVEALCEPTRTDGLIQVRVRVDWFRGDCTDASVTGTISKSGGSISLVDGYTQGGGCNLYVVVASVNSNCTGTTCTLNGNFDWWYYYTFFYGVQDPGDITIYDTFVATLTMPNPRYEITYDVTENLNSNCGQLEANESAGFCTLVSDVCLIGPETRNLNGLDVTRDCWEYETTYNCAAGPSNDDCAPLREQGCEQIDSACSISFGDGSCSVFNQTMRCPDNNCAPATEVICGDQAFCIEGSCVDQSYPADTGFAKSATYLQVLEEASKDFDTENFLIFTGTPEMCEVDPTKDCCDLDGLLYGNITDCTEQDKTLAEKRNAGLCHYVGLWCVEEYPLGIGGCYRVGHRYCCFNSKLGRIIQEQGRVQLGLDWGSPDFPNCDGLTPDQLASLDFSQMDLSEFFGDIVITLPDEAAVQDRVQQQVDGFYNP